jgi:hypothetical protein
MNQHVPKPTAVLHEDTSYIDDITAMLRDLLRQVIRQREPAVLPFLDNPESAANIPENLIEHGYLVAANEHRGRKCFHAEPPQYREAKRSG